jgi:hypothetical protein
MPLLEIIFLLIIAATVTGYAYIYLGKNREREKLSAAFYRLLSQQDSCISLIQLTAIAGVDSKTAKIFLEEQIKTLGGMLEIDEEGETFYRFPRLKLPNDIVNSNNNDDW